jgi:GT2 family glycosyltransferase
LSDPSGTTPDVSLVVVNFNGAACLARCLDSLRAGEDPCSEVIVVDNASSDGSPAILAAYVDAHPRIGLIRSPTNRGYAGAVNLALPQCRGRYVGVLNMDVIAEPGWLAPLIEFLDAHPDAGAVNPLLTFLDGNTVNAIGQDLHVTGLGFNRGLGQPRSQVGLQPLVTDGLHGAAFVIRRDLLERVGGMDESGFLYHEDVHLSWMLRMLGYRVACLPVAIVRHDYFLSMHAVKFYLLERNRWSLLLSVLRRPTLLALTPFLLLTELMAWGYSLLRGRRFLHAKARSYAYLWRQRTARSAQRDRIRALRTVGDLQLLRGMQLGYAWGQFRTLARERGPPRRPLAGA